MTDGHDNLIPAVRGDPKLRKADTPMHMKFVVWAMQQRDIDAITVRRVKSALHVSMPTAQKLRDHWRDLTATRFYHDSAPQIVEALRLVYGLGAANEG